MALRGGWRAPDERVGAYTAAVRYVPAQGGRYRIEALRRIVRDAGDRARIDRARRPYWSGVDKSL